MIYCVLMKPNETLQLVITRSVYQDLSELEEIVQLMAVEAEVFVYIFDLT